MKKHIPNILTLGNLCAGCIGVDLAYAGKLEYAALAIGVGAFFDFTDGLVARLLQVKSLIGKELDSLADLVTFGFLPAIILLKMAYNGPDFMPVVYIVFLYTVCAALRLAKFNVDERQTNSFIGLPTPAAAIFVGSLPFILTQQPLIARHFVNIPGILAIVISLSLLMVIELPLFSLKFENFGWKDNKLRISFLLLSLLLLVFMQVLAIPAIIVLYIITSIIARINHAV